MDPSFRAELLKRIAADAKIAEELPNEGVRERVVIGQVLDELIPQAPVSESRIADELIARGFTTGNYEVIHGLHKAINAR